jgi:hypothetical protein
MGTVAEAQAAARARLAAAHDESGVGVLNRTIGQGAREGIEDLVALPETILELARPESGVGRWTPQQAAEIAELNEADRLGPSLTSYTPTEGYPSIGAVRHFTEETLGIDRPEAQGRAEKVLREAVRGATGSLVPAPVRALPFLAGTGFVGGGSAELAGQAAEVMGTGYEGAARIVAGLLGVTVSGLPFILKDAKIKVLKEVLENVPADKMDDAIRIIENARREGVRVLGPEALDAPGIRALAGDVAASPAGAQVFNRATEGRNLDMVAAVKARLLEIASTGASPREIVRTIREAAAAALTRAKKIRTDGSQPLYAAVGVGSPLSGAADASALLMVENFMDPAAFKRLVTANPAVEQAIKRARSDKLLKQDTVYINAEGKRVKLKGNNVKVLDAAFKELGDQITEAVKKGRGNRARILKKAQNNLRETIEAQFPVYGEAVDEFARLSRMYVDPLEESVVGELVKAKGFRKTAGKVLNVDEMTPDDIRDTMNQLAMINPAVPGEITARVVKSALDKTLEAGGTTQAFLKRVLFETPMQKANMRALYNSVEMANGLPKDSLFNGAQRLLDVLDRVGTIPGRGSPTQPRQALEASLRSGKAGLVNIGQASFIGSTLRKLDNYLTAGSYRKLAEVMTAPDSIAQMRKLANLDPKGTAARLVLVNMLGLAREGQVDHDAAREALTAAHSRLRAEELRHGIQ